MNVVLTGFMGTGKSSVGRALAAKLGLDFVDTDRLVTEKAGMEISEIFSGSGEARFRELESEVVGEVTSGRDGVVVATGGGVVIDASNREKLGSFARVVCLTASMDVIMERVAGGSVDEGDAGGDERPLLRGPHKRSEAQQLLASRQRFYAEAELTIDTSAMTVSEVVEAAYNYLSSK